MILAKEIKLRNPFTLVRQSLLISLLIKFYRYVYDKPGTTVTQEVKARRSFRHGLRRAFFESFWKFYPVKFGKFFLEDQDGERICLPFNAKNTQFHALYLKRYRHGYEPEVTNFIDQVLPDNGVFYDIGANWGYFSFFTATKPGFQGQIYAFEPLLSAFEDLGSLVEHTEMEKIINYFQIALSDNQGFGSMSIPDGIHTGLAEFRESVDGQGAVRVSRLDDFNLRTPDLIKIDAEGYESRIIKGGASLIRGKKPIIIFENVIEIEDPEITLEPFNLLEKWGYVFFQPAWLVDGQLLIPDNRALFRSGNKKLALVQFSAIERLSRSQKINCIACHQDQLNSLKNSFHELS